jgi:hypothetical protein
MADCFGVPASTGWLVLLLSGAADRLGDFLDHVRGQPQDGEVAHFDEIGRRGRGDPALDPRSRHRPVKMVDHFGIRSR